MLLFLSLAAWLAVVTVVLAVCRLAANSDAMAAR